MRKFLTHSISSIAGLQYEMGNCLSVSRLALSDTIRPLVHQLIDSVNPVVGSSIDPLIVTSSGPLVGQSVVHLLVHPSKFEEIIVRTECNKTTLY